MIIPSNMAVIEWLEYLAVNQIPVSNKIKETIDTFKREGVMNEKGYIRKDIKEIFEKLRIQNTSFSETDIMKGECQNE